MRFYAENVQFKSIFLRKPMPNWQRRTWHVVYSRCSGNAVEIIDLIRTEHIDIIEPG
jgi:hypothetical protein